MKTLFKTCLVVTLAASLAAVFAGSALAAPYGPAQGKITGVMDSSALQTPSAQGPVVALAPDLVLECIVCPKLALQPGTDAGATPGGSPQETPELPEDPEEPPLKPGDDDAPGDDEDGSVNSGGSETPATPETPEVTTEPEQPQVSTSKLPNTGTKLMLIALAAIGMVGGAPLVGMWVDNRLNKQ